MNVALIIAQGVATRNFVCGRFLEVLRRGGRNRVSLVHALPDASIEDDRDRLDGTVDWHRLPPFGEDPLAHLVRRTFSWGHMRACDTKAMRLMLEGSRIRQGGWGETAVRHISWQLSKLCNTHRRVRAWTGLHDRLARLYPATGAMGELWRRLEPDVVLSTDQRPVRVVPAVLAARHRGIPVGTFIFSWDNLSSKERMPTDYDFYLVWSELMRRELLQFYPHIDPAQVHVTGTTQFEPYAEDAIVMSREEFGREVGADPDRPIICYAGEDVSTDPEGPAHLAALCDLVRAGAVRGRPQVLLRPTPSDLTGRYEPVRSRYPEIIWCPPRWRRPAGASWQEAACTSDDVRLLASIVQHCALCVNVTSTMTLDFAIMDRPSVNIAFDVADPPPRRVPVRDYLFQFDHYRPVLEFGAARIAYTPAELAAHVNAYLADPALDRLGRQRFVELEVCLPIDRASERIAGVLTRVAGGS